MPPSIALLGGTFDPIHFGHLRIALEIQQRWSFDEVRLMPCNQPGHRDQPLASAAQRLDMLRLATEDTPELLVDDREIQRGGVSYMADTLAQLREEVGSQASISLVLGMDSFVTLEFWSRWQAILDLANLLVVARPGNECLNNEFCERLVHARSVDSAEALLDAPQGRIFIQQLSLLDISASRIRQLVKQGHSPRFLLPNATLEYIHDHSLYQ